MGYHGKKSEKRTVTLERRVFVFWSILIYESIHKFKDNLKATKNIINHEKMHLNNMGIKYII